MEEKRFEAGRFFLKDTIRLQVDFSTTDQSRGRAAPPLQQPCSPNFARVDLPSGPDTLARLTGIPLGAAIAGRESVRRFSETSLSLEELSMLLYATQGVRKVLGPECALRVVPSAGARHAFESYVAVSRVDDLTPGLYRYLPFDNQLARLYEDKKIGRRTAEACHWQQFAGKAAAVFFWTAVPSRMEWRYAEAAHKVIAVDAGHVCQNLYLAVQAIGAGTCAIAAYNQAACDSLLGVDGSEEFTVYIAPVGKC
ncbi:MAG TPA: SagB/ThcOx family dehydrogenase [Candidatus Hydrogenedentes bacterium]|nr:MAG: Nitroreductase family protein [Candidatus Hydrogenedentes bacterium ADurb.Bin179]HOH31219.1 SagB/ThcOx family dehydrogenase [Candidatus Hydrogenedentota bacterium]